MYSKEVSDLSGMLAAPQIMESIKNPGVLQRETRSLFSSFFLRFSGLGANDDQCSRLDPRVFDALLVQTCFDRSTLQMERDGKPEEAESLMDATVHWLRHTGISDDVKIRPREHVRDDAGHSSGAITDKYIDIELKERHRSAKEKRINMLENRELNIQ